VGLLYVDSKYYLYLQWKITDVFCNSSWKCASDVKRWYRIHVDFFCNLSLALIDTIKISLDDKTNELVGGIDGLF